MITIWLLITDWILYFLTFSTFLATWAPLLISWILTNVTNSQEMVLQCNFLGEQLWSAAYLLAIRYFMPLFYILHKFKDGESCNCLEWCFSRMGSKWVSVCEIKIENTCWDCWQKVYSYINMIIRRLYIVLSYYSRNLKRSF